MLSFLDCDAETERQQNGSILLGRHPRQQAVSPLYRTVEVKMTWPAFASANSIMGLHERDTNRHCHVGAGDSDDFVRGETPWSAV